MPPPTLNYEEPHCVPQLRARARGLMHLLALGDFRYCVVYGSFF